MQNYVETNARKEKDKAKEQKKAAELKQQQNIAHRFTVAGMRADNAQDFAHAIMKEDDDVVTDTKSADIIEEK